MSVDPSIWASGQTEKCVF